MITPEKIKEFAARYAEKAHPNDPAKQEICIASFISALNLRQIIDSTRYNNTHGLGWIKPSDDDVFEKFLKTIA